MKNISCTHEDAVTAAARSGEWTPELEAHRDGCMTCAELTLVVAAMAADAEELLRPRRPPPGSRCDLVPGPACGTGEQLPACDPGDRLGATGDDRGGRRHRVRLCAGSVDVDQGARGRYRYWIGGGGVATCRRISDSGGGDEPPRAGWSGVVGADGGPRKLKGRAAICGPCSRAVGAGRAPPIFEFCSKGSRS